MKKINGLVEQWNCYRKSKKLNDRDEHIWVFGEWFGNRCGDNSAFLANYIAQKYPEEHLYWIAKNGCNTDFLNESINVLLMDSGEAKELLNKAGVIVVNQNFLDITTSGYNEFATAITLNLWHGIMWKQIGHDGDKRKNNILFKIYCHILDPVQRCKYYVTPSELYGKNIISAFGAKKEGFIKCGYPRNSLFYNPLEVTKSKAEIREMIGACADSIIITYMPTFRDQGDVIEDLRTIEDKEFIDYLDQNDIYIIQKAHFVNKKTGRSEIKTLSDRIICLDDVNPTNLLAGSDMLITDYSSCFFDYLILDRPIIHFLYDFEKYKNVDRGLYYDQKNVVCGDVVYSKAELISAIMNNNNDPGKEAGRRRKMKDIHAQYETEDSCNIIYNKIKEIQGYSVS